MLIGLRAKATAIPVPSDNVVECSAASVKDRNGSFVVSAAQDAATRAIVDQEVIDFSLSDSRAFAEGLLNPPPISAPLRAAAKRYKKIMAS